MEKLGKILPGIKEKAKSTNPFTGEVVAEHEFLTDDQLSDKIQESWSAYLHYRKTDPKERARRFARLAEIISSNLDKYARMITLETGKALKSARLEVKMAIKECRFLAENTEKFLEPEKLDSEEARCAYVSYLPLGVIFHLTPFNFPFWLLFRATIGALAMGNTVINKNSQTCSQIGILAEEAFREAGFTSGEFMNLIINQSQSESVIKNPSIRGVSFTGSIEGGAKIAAWAGQYCKKSLMDLGGNDPFIVLKDADLDLAVEHAVKGRLENSGQCSTAAKRFIIDETVYASFKSKLLDRVRTVKVGDPLDESTDVGPLAKKSGLEKQKDQLKRAIKSGAKVLWGGEEPKDERLSKGYFFMPTVIEVEDSNPVCHEETFGPLFTLVKFKTEVDAIRMSNDTEYGLGSAIFTRDVKRAEELGKDLDTGALYINHYVDWDPACPEGGVKMSGYGRDGGRHGAYEFANIRTVWIG